MDRELKSVNIALNVIDPDIMLSCLINAAQEIHNKIIDAINLLENKNENENDRIKIAFAFFWREELLAEKNAGNHSEELAIELAELENKISKYQEPCFLELLLTEGLVLLGSIAYSLEEGNIPEALECLSFGNLALGMAKGIEYGYGLSKAEIKQMFKSNALKGHKEHHAIKEDVIKHYQKNAHLYEHKDDAAYKISKKIAPAKPSTIRRWLKGVQPE